MSLELQFLMAAAFTLAVWVAMRWPSAQQRAATRLAGEARTQGWNARVSPDGCASLAGLTTDGHAWRMVVDLRDDDPDYVWWETEVEWPLDLRVAIRSGAAQPQRWVDLFVLPGHLTEWREHGLLANESTLAAVDIFGRQAAMHTPRGAAWGERLQVVATDPILAATVLEDASVARRLSDLLAHVDSRASWGLQSWVGPGVVRVRGAFAVGGIDALRPVMALGEAIAARVRQVHDGARAEAAAPSSPRHGGRHMISTSRSAIPIASVGLMTGLLCLAPGLAAGATGQAGVRAQAARIRDQAAQDRLAAAAADTEKVNRAPVTRTYRRPADPEAAALLLNLLARYAADASDKTDLDRRIQAALGDAPRSRQVTQRFIDRFLKLPLQVRQDLFGPLANLTTQAFEPSRYDAAFARVLRAVPQIDAGSTGSQRLSRPMSVGMEPTYTLRYKGMNCFAETDWDQASASDEIYIIGAILTVEDGQPVTRTVRLPVGVPMYENVDAGESFPSAPAPIHQGPRQELGLVFALYEQDFSDAEEQRKAVDSVVKAAAAVVVKVAPVTAVILTPGVVSAIASLVSDVMDFEDDLIAQHAVTLPDDQVVSYGAAPPELVDRGIQFHFETRYEGEGALYKAYFDFERTDAATPDLSNDATAPTGFSPAPGAPAVRLEGAWGDATTVDASRVNAIIRGTPSGSGTFTVGTSERPIGGAAAVTVNADGVQLSRDDTWAYSSPLYGQATAAKSAPGGVFAGDAFGRTRSRGGSVATGGVPGTGASSASGATRPIAGSAYALLLPSNVRLQVFLEDRPEGEVRNYRIRYVRLNESGGVVADVMLRPAQVTPR